jgi:hypothetical protein
MTRIATLHDATKRATEARISPLRQTLQKVEHLQKDLQEVETMTAAQSQALAQALLPVAAAMARLTDETRAALAQLQDRTTKSAAAIESAHQDAKASSAAATKAARSIAGATTHLVEAAKAPPPRSLAPWLAAAVPTLAVLWLAWRVGALG